MLWGRCRDANDCRSGTRCCATFDPWFNEAAPDAGAPPEGNNPALLAIAAEALLVCIAEDGGGAGSARLPLTAIKDVDLPGGATRFDYQDIHAALGHLVVTHMLDDSVLIVDLADESVLKELPGIKTAHGVVVAEEVGAIFVTSLPNQLVLIDHESMEDT
jgi:hypothetical protein